MDQFLSQARSKLSQFSCGINTVLEEKNVPPGEPVYINVYDLHWTNEITKNVGFGIYHSGVQVYGKEYGYGGHPYEYSGIFEIEPKDADQMGQEFSYNQSVLIGHTYFNEASVDRFITSIQDEFGGSSYHLLRHNCNHFSERLVSFLCNVHLPSWINRTASLVSSVKFLEKMIPNEYMRPPTQDEYESALQEEEEEEVLVSNVEEKPVVEVKVERGGHVKPNTTFNVDKNNVASLFSHS
ncbi:hypothetical protein Ciccas_005419 [Cichlidogyrus casuarinus]|uniref:PPPDE domain-containing protein n=1 Tax=Cichlidogyrus casuarinus TaxID=1844966 RepID=A0ABD2Q956_9PLAT